MRPVRVLIIAALFAGASIGSGCGWMHGWAPHWPAHWVPQWHSKPGPPPIYDLNRASLRKIKTLPGITPSMAERIVEGRPYDSKHDLVARGILTERELQRIDDRVRVGDSD